ncbi:hypothetical protein BGW42_004669 [Actinomortierella wolfii]|nr:hypothetical protein BGW42_004669 [Actinomortierella wolfii]KAG0239015.1 hypothetical protein BGW41_007962 [Actinomortierella wolfii]
MSTETRVTQPETPLRSAEPRNEVIVQPILQIGSFSSDPTAEAVEIYRNPRNHADAIASILSYAGNQTNFHPSSGVQKPTESFHDYVKKIDSFPAFTPTFHNSKSSKLASIRPQVMAEAVIDAYRGILDLDAKTIIESIKKIARTVQSSTRAEETNTLFSQVTLKKHDDSDKYTLSIFYTSFRMSRVEDAGRFKTDISEDQEFVIHRTVYDVNTSVLVANAANFARTIATVPVLEWLQDISSPITPGVTSCYDRALPTSEE